MADVRRKQANQGTSQEQEPMVMLTIRNLFPFRVVMLRQEYLGPVLQVWRGCCPIKCPGMGWEVKDRARVPLSCSGHLRGSGEPQGASNCQATPAGYTSLRDDSSVSVVHLGLSNLEKPGHKWGPWCPLGWQSLSHCGESCGHVGESCNGSNFTHSELIASHP